MRIRQIKPSYWLDKDLHLSLTAAQREFYIGLWMLADDAGWLDWDVTRIGAELYPYRGVSRREREVTACAMALSTLDAACPHLLILDCGHARVPKLVDHQRFGGRPVVSVRDAHARTCAQLSADARPGSARAGGKGKVGNGKVAREDDAAEPSSGALGQRLVAEGLNPAILGKAS